MTLSIASSNVHVVAPKMERGGRKMEDGKMARDVTLE
jgi:hypothetical protein